MSTPPARTIILSYAPSIIERSRTGPRKSSAAATILACMRKRFSKSLSTPYLKYSSVLFGIMGPYEARREHSPCRQPKGKLLSPRKCCISVSFTSVAHSAGAADVNLVATRFGDGVLQPLVVLGHQHPLGARQVVVEEARVGEAAANVGEIGHVLVVGQLPPGRQRDLECAEPDVVGRADLLHHLGRRHADDAYHGAHAFTGRLLPEDACNLPELGQGHRIPFARGAKDIKIAKP